ncbi:MAG: hypothetical protein WC908_02620 [Candidatus Paceibacterota bacterium]
MHNHENKQGRGIMWMMMICCVVPIVLLLVFGVGNSASNIGGNSKWIIWIVIAIMIGSHLFMMRKPHKNSNKETEILKEGEEEKVKNNSSNSCH